MEVHVNIHSTQLGILGSLYHSGRSGSIYLTKIHLLYTAPDNLNIKRFSLGFEVG